jgi:hypothetical protein
MKKQGRILFGTCLVVSLVMAPSCMVEVDEPPDPDWEDAQELEIESHCGDCGAFRYCSFQNECNGPVPHGCCFVGSKYCYILGCVPFETECVCPPSE